MIRTELLEAVKSGEEARLSHALEHARPNDLDYMFTHPDSCTLLHIASQNNAVKMVTMLLEAGAAPNIRVNIRIEIQYMMDDFIPSPPVLTV